MKKLKKITDFISEIDDYVKESHNFERGCKLIFKYCEFLKQPLELWMFVPCDENGNVLEHPDIEENRLRNSRDGGWWNEFVEYKNKYQQAKERCLFEGFIYSQIGYWYINTEENGKLMFDEEYVENKTIEDLIIYELELTSTAIN